MRRHLPLLALLSTLLASPFVAAHDRGDLVDTARTAGEFETLLAAADAAGLVDALQGDGPLTVFAPTDDAFGALPAGTVDRLLRPENREELAALLRFHVVAGRIGSDALADGARLQSLEGRALTFAASEAGFTVQGARLVATDVLASNGIVHIVDRVLLPPARMSRRAARERIEDAVARGATRFNHGDAAWTLDLYTNTARTLLTRASLEASERERLERALRVHRDGRSDVQGAWTLRHALDDVYASLDDHGRRTMRRLATGG